MKRLLVVLAALLSTSPAFAQAPEWKRDPGISWACAGVGSDERRAIEAMRPQARLEIRFVTEKRGAFLAGVDLTLVGPGSTTPLLKTRAEGPVCLADLPPGAYRIEAMLGDARRSKRVVVGAKGTTRAILAFPDEPWDGIRASPEERAQAARP